MNWMLTTLNTFTELDKFNNSNELNWCLIHLTYENDWIDCIEYREKYEKMYLARFEKLFTKNQFKSLSGIVATRRIIEKERNKKVHELERELDNLNSKKTSIRMTSYDSYLSTDISPKLPQIQRRTPPVKQRKIIK